MLSFRERNYSKMNCTVQSFYRKTMTKVKPYIVIPVLSLQQV